MKWFKSKKEKERLESMKSYVGIMDETDKKESVPEPIHAKCDICRVTDFRDNMVELNAGIAQACRERGYEVYSKGNTNAIFTWGNYFSDISSGFIHAKCAKMTPSDDGNGWMFKDKPLPKEEE